MTAPALELLPAATPQRGHTVQRRDGRVQLVGHVSPGKRQEPCQVFVRSRGHYVPDLTLELAEFRRLFAWEEGRWVEA